MKYIYILLILALFSCKKNVIDKTYSGTVKTELVSCSGEGGLPFIVTIESNSTFDSISTLTLPNKYWSSGKKIKFKQRELNKSDAIMFCNGLFSIPKQIVIYDVTEY